MSTPFKMKGFSGYGNSPLKQDKVDWGKAPALNTHDRKRWYDKNNLKQDETTKTEGYHSVKTGKWTNVGGDSGNKYPNKSSQIDMTKTKPGSEGALWHMNLKIQETPKKKTQKQNYKVFDDARSMGTNSKK